MGELVNGIEIYIDAGTIREMEIRLLSFERPGF